MTTSPLQPEGSPWRSRVFWGTFLLATAVCLLRVSSPGISDPSEGRYVEISWEMARSKDFLVPRWNGVPHLEKPPLAYWAGAAGMLLLGENETGARLFSALALLWTALLAGGIARRVAGPRAAVPAFAAVALSPYCLAVGGALLTDPFVLLGTALFYWAVFRKEDGDFRAAGEVAVLGLSIGFFAKGYVILLFTLLPILFSRRSFFRELGRLRPIALFFLLCAPWFVAIQLRYPQFLPYHVRKLVAFSTTTRSLHHAPFFIYIVVLAGGLFPFSLWARAGGKGMDSGPRRILLWWLLLPLAVLTAAPSRQWTYILPAAPALAVFGGAGLAKGALARYRRLHSAAPLVAAFVCVALALLAPRHTPLAAASGTLFRFASVLFACSVILYAGARNFPRRAAICTGALVCGAMVWSSVVDEPLFKIDRKLALEVARRAGDEVPVWVVGLKIPSLPFYLHRPVVVAGRDDRLAEEERLWGDSPYFRPELGGKEAVAAGAGGIVLLPGSDRERIAPASPPAVCLGGICVLDLRKHTAGGRETPG